MKQGDVLSAILFNCVLDSVFVKWKAQLFHEGIQVRGSGERITNIRYADDILLVAKSRAELLRMAELLVLELARVGLTLNSAKTKILHTSYEDDGHDVDFVEIAGDFVSVLHPKSWHKYLGRHIFFATSPC